MKKHMFYGLLLAAVIIATPFVFALADMSRERSGIGGELLLMLCLLLLVIYKWREAVMMSRELENFMMKVEEQQSRFIAGVKELHSMKCSMEYRCPPNYKNSQSKPPQSGR